MDVSANILLDLFGKASSVKEKSTSATDGMVLRYNGCLNNHAGEIVKDTAPVTFLSMPYLDLASLDTEKSTDGFHSRKPLLHTFHGYRVNTNRELKQVVRKLPAVSGNQALHVSQLWCLVLGSGKSPSPCPLPNCRLTK